MQKYTVYTVNNLDEEGPCEYCGAPLYHGDTAYLDADKVYCSTLCAHRDGHGPRLLDRAKLADISPKEPTC